MSEAPFASRPFGWCQDYDLGPAAQHGKCDGLIAPEGGKHYRCPCSCHEEDDVGPWEIVLPLTRPLSLNSRQHWSKKAADVAQLRGDAMILTKEAKVPKLERVRVTLIYEPRTVGRRDPINLAATLKPVQDGIVDAGIVPDDTPQYMESPMPLIDLPNGKKGKLWVLLEDIA